MSCTVPAAEPAYLSGTELERTWRQPVTLVRERSAAGDVLRELAASQQIACRIDRRIDPSQLVTLQLRQQPLRAVLDAVAGQIGCRCGRVGDSIVIGDAEQLDRWLTQTELLSNRLTQDRSIAAGRRLQLTQGKLVAWDELDSPGELLEDIESQWELTITNPELVPHDLWAGGALAGVDAVEALGFVLGQFDLSWEWDPGCRRITIVPLPIATTVERSHRPKGMTLSTGLAKIKASFPEIQATQRGTTLQVQASVLQHEAIAVELGEVSAARPATAGEVPVSRRRFSNVRIVRKSAADVLQALTAQGLDIEYDPATLTAAGADLTTLLTLEYESISAEDLIAAICRTVKLTYRIDGAKIYLSSP